VCTILPWANHFYLMNKVENQNQTWTLYINQNLPMMEQSYHQWYCCRSFLIILKFVIIAYKIEWMKNGRLQCCRHFDLGFSPSRHVRHIFCTMVCRLKCKTNVSTAGHTDHADVHRQLIVINSNSKRAKQLGTVTCLCDWI